MATNPNTALSASSFIKSIGINVHMAYTDGAYASEPNVASDLAYLGIGTVRDALPTNISSIPVQNQIAALNELAARGMKFDLITTNTNVQTQINAANAMQASSPGAIIAVEGPNEINNWPVTYNGLTGQAAATAFQTAFYSAVQGDSALKGVSVYNFTGGTSPVKTPYGTMTQNANGSFTLVNGITGWLAYLPVGLTTIKATYIGPALCGGLFSSPGAGQQSSLTYGANGVLTFTYNNTGTKPLQTYISFSDWNATSIITSLTASSGNSGNLVTFDPNMSLAGMADASNTHPYPSNGAAPGSLITKSIGLPIPGPRVITEDGYNTDPNSANGVSQTVQAQDEVKILLDGYKAGVSQTYLYELLDEKPDASNANAQMHFGVFNADNTPKLAAVAIHNLTTLLTTDNAPVAGFTPGTLAWSATGLPTTANTMLLEKTNGAFDLAVWNEASATTPPAAVSIALGATYGTVEVFDPVAGSAPIAILTNVSQVNLSLGADPLVIEVEPAAPLAALAHSGVSAAPKMAFLASPTAAASTAPATAWRASILSAQTAGVNVHHAAALPGSAGLIGSVLATTTTPTSAAATGYIAATTQSLTATTVSALLTAQKPALLH